METNEKQYCVYVHTNKTNGKKYVGITSMKPKDRWKNGRGYARNQHFFRAIKKYGWNEGFTHEIVAEGLSLEDAHQMERDLISEYNCMHPNGYNSTSGGEIGKEPSAEIRKRLSEINTERMNNPELREHLRQKAKEQMSDPNMRLLLSELKQGVYDGNKNPRYGTGRRVVQLTRDGIYINTYISATDAAKQTGIDRQSIYRCCADKQKTAGGFIWMYLEEYELKTQQNDLNINE